MKTFPLRDKGNTSRGPLSATNPLAPSLAAALELLADGQIPIPLVPRDKKPPEGFLWATVRDSGRLPTEQEVRSWWARWPWADLGRVIPEGQVVVDVDPKNDGLTSFAELDPELRALVMAAPKVFSGRGDGGFHGHLKLPEGACAPRKCTLAVGIDLLPAGNLEVMPPSRHKTGGTYFWEGKGTPLPVVPAALLPSRQRVGDFTDARRTCAGRGPALTVDQAVEWRNLWATVGIDLHPGDRLYRCAFHEDRTPSLSIDAEHGLWNCFAGCGKGGLRDLRDRLGISPPGQSRGQSVSNSLGAIPRGVLPREIDTRAPEPVFCRQGATLGFLVGNDFVYRRTPCHLRLCETCGPQLAARHATPVLADLEDGARLYELRVPADEARALKTRISRAGGAFKAFPASAGRVRVFTTAPFGVVVDDPAVALHDAFMAAARETGRIISASRAWKLTPEAEHAVPEGPGVELLGIVGAGEAWARRQAQRIARRRAVDDVDVAGQRVGFHVTLSENPLARAAQLDVLCEALDIRPHTEVAHLKKVRLLTRLAVA